MIWMAVTADKYELPIAVECSSYALAKKLGTSQSNIKSKESRKASGISCGYKVVKIKENDG